MASDNRTLGRFDLIGIPAAPRGIPQIEVTFDIDANGIVHVSAKDLATGKEQKIRIESSSGLSDSDIDKMLKDAEAHAKDDQEKKKSIEVRNNADAMAYSTEKMMRENADKISDSDKAAVEAAIAEVRKALEGSDVAAIESAVKNLEQASHTMAQAMYEAASKAQQASAGPGPEAAAAGDGGKASGEDEHPVDADFTVVDDDKKE